MHRIRGALPSRQMASRIPAIGRRGRQVVVVVDVARCARHIGMPIGQHKPGRAVVERCRRPTDRRMARRAIGKSKSRPGRWMHRVRGLLPRRQMASRVSAIGRRNHQVIVVINMAGSARHVGMPIGQHKPGRAVVKRSGEPGVHSVASLTGRREFCVNVVGIGSQLKISRMA